MMEVLIVIVFYLGEVFDGLSGCIIFGVLVCIVDFEGKEVKLYNMLGELFVKGFQIVMGYYKCEKVMREIFLVDGWFWIGDEVEIRCYFKIGDFYLFVVDRMKELIKVFGY